MKNKKALSKNETSGTVIESVICPICNTAYDKFAYFVSGTKSRDNAQCSNCKSLERHRLLWKYLREKTDFFTRKNKKILHFAPEKMFYDIFSDQSDIEYYPCDLYPEGFQYSGKSVIHKVDITNIPFPDNFFDVVICNHVLEHIIDDRLAMSELYRIMNKDSWGIFQVPINYSLDNTFEDFSIIDPKEREKAFGQNDHVRWYGKDYKERLASVGFKVNEDPYVKLLPVEQRKKYGLHSFEYIYYCQK